MTRQHKASRYKDIGKQMMKIISELQQASWSWTSFEMIPHFPFVVPWTAASDVLLLLLLLKEYF